jgi:hypothetical protein
MFQWNPVVQQGRTIHRSQEVAVAVTGLEVIMAETLSESSQCLQAHLAAVLVHERVKLAPRQQVEEKAEL